MHGSLYGFMGCLTEEVRVFCIDPFRFEFTLINASSGQEFKPHAADQIAASVV